MRVESLFEPASLTDSYSPSLCESMSSRSFLTRSPGSPSSGRSPRCSARELELRLLNYRDTTPLRNGQVDDDPYGGGAGMVLRVDVVAAALEAGVRRGPRPPGDRADTAGPPARSGGRRGARRRRAADAALGPVRGLRRTGRGAPHDRRDLDRPLRPVRRRAARDGRDRRDRTPAAGSARARSRRSSSRASPRSSTAVSSTRTTHVRPNIAAGMCRTSCSPATTEGLRSGDESKAAQGPRPEKPDRPVDAWSSAPVANRHRLGDHDPRRDRDRPRDQGLRRQPVPDPVVLDGADPALRAARERLRVAVVGPRAREPVHLPLPRSQARRDRRLQDAPRRGGRVQQRRPAAAERPSSSD